MGARAVPDSKGLHRVGIKGLTGESLGRDRGESIKVLPDVIGNAGLSQMGKLGASTLTPSSDT